MSTTAQDPPRTAPAVGRPDRPSGGSGPGLGRTLLQAWRGLTSMRTALLLLFLLALAAVPGSLIPQRPAAPLRTADWLERNPTVGPLAERLGLLDVFAAPWFAAIYLLLMVSLAGCIVPRLRRYATALRQPPPPAPRRLDRLPSSARLEVDGTPGDVAAVAVRALRRGRWRVRSERTPEGGSIVRAEKGHLREAGNLVFHLAVVVVLVGVAVSAYGGYRGDVLLPEGRGFSNVVANFDDVELSRGTGAADLTPFSVTLDDVSATFADDGTPTDFAAEVTYSEEPGAPERRGTVRVNHPLRVGGADVFLANYGYTVRLTVRDGNGDVQEVVQPCLPQDSDFGSTCTVKLPDAAPVQLALSAQLFPTAGQDEAGQLRSASPRPDRPLLVVMPFAGSLGLDSGIPQNVYALPVDRLVPADQRVDGCDPVAAQARAQLCPLVPEDGRPAALAPGQTFALPGGVGSVTFEGVGEWGRFTVVEEPGQWLLLGAAVAVVVGISASLRGRRRRVWVRAQPAGADGGAGRTVVEVGGLARNDADSADEDVDDLVARLSSRPGDTRGRA